MLILPWTITGPHKDRQSIQNHQLTRHASFWTVAGSQITCNPHMWRGSMQTPHQKALLAGIRQRYNSTTTALRQLCDSATTALRQLYDSATTALRQRYDSATTALRQRYDSANTTPTTMPLFYFPFCSSSSIKVGFLCYM